MTETEIWTKWESQVVNGIFPLRRFLGRSNHSVVFLTECRAQKLARAAIKLIPADPARAESQLARWQLAAALSHPHLIRILEAGRCKLGGHPFLFVVTEYAEQNLAQILPHRALVPAEVLEMLHPALDALDFLHRQNLLHGQLKASNFLVVNDQLQLASDTIRTAGDPNGIELAKDVQALGETLVEALTQTRPALDTPANAISLPASLTPGFAQAVRRCLSLEAGDRPTVTELRRLIDPATEAPAESAQAVSATAVAVTARPASAAMASRTGLIGGPATRWLIPAAAVGLVLLAVWIGGRVLRGRAESSRSPAAPMVAPSVAREAAPSAATTQPAASPVVHEEIPAVARAARDSIRGQIKVAVRVTIDRAGNVVAQNLETRGSSRYFARLALDAAKKWKFAPADAQSPKEWLVQFEFSRDGVTGHAVARLRP